MGTNYYLKPIPNPLNADEYQTIDGKPFYPIIRCELDSNGVPTHWVKPPQLQRGAHIGKGSCEFYLAVELETIYSWVDHPYLKTRTDVECVVDEYGIPVTLVEMFEILKYQIDHERISDRFIGKCFS